MRSYHIRIHLSNHNVIDAKTEATSLSNAVNQIVTADQAEMLIGDNRIEAIKLVDSKDIEPAPYTSGTKSPLARDAGLSPKEVSPANERLPRRRW